jgi:hypothetical protein
LTTSQSFLKAFKSADATQSLHRGSICVIWDGDRRYLLLGYVAVSIGMQILSQQPGFLDLKALESADATDSRHPTEVLCKF